MSEFGILERIEEKLDNLVKAFNSASTAVEACAETIKPIASEVDVDAEGLPWIDEINSTPPGKTAKGIWKRKKGVTAEKFAQVRSEFKSPAPAAPPAALAPAAPPAAPTPAAPPAAPAPAAPPAAPAPAEVFPDKQDAIQAVADLTSVHGVDYDGIMEVVNDIDPSVKTFNGLPDGSMSAAKSVFQAWSANLELAKKYEEGIAKFSEGKATESIPTIYQRMGVNAAKDVHHNDLPEVISGLKEFHDKWENYFNSIQPSEG